MASSIALRRASTLFSKPLSPSSVFRSLNTNAQLSNFSDDRSVSSRRDSSPRFLPGFILLFPLSTLNNVFGPFSPRSLSQMLNLMDRFMENPFISRGMGSWDLKEDDNTLLLRMDMPGISKDDVKISVQSNTLTIKGEAQAEPEHEESARRYSGRIDLPPSLYKVDEIKAEMKNGVLKLVVPKVKEEVNEGFQVKVD
ncbi:hypothetical protein Ddye_016564 [Dipteronia dyeriana]|uniref:SHSP domain-containing protein n=1 Tax=Dipteronia dyeriana TaxID=168575 RepID=A0AAD9U7S8_9ROSI|nr:hypothetical protein Ddye_016564 [Dipteronia dyeriana]